MKRSLMADFVKDSKSSSQQFEYKTESQPKSSAQKKKVVLKDSKITGFLQSGVSSNDSLKHNSHHNENKLNLLDEATVLQLTLL